MAPPLKAFFSPALVRRLAADVARVDPGFPQAAFERQATRGLAALELMARAAHLSRALADHLTGPYPRALATLLASLPPPTDPPATGAMAPFYFLPHTMFVAEHGLDHFDLSLDAQRVLTQRFTAEWSIRAFLAADPERTFARMTQWARDPIAEVRRLASEGTRPRLPWGRRVAWIDAHPQRVVALLERLRDDPAEVVRRSVANNLNDHARDHADLVVATCRAWSQGASPARQALIRHALRSLVKAGHPGALAVLGAGAAPQVEVTGVRITPRTVRLGCDVAVSFQLRSTAARPQQLVVDYAVHLVKASGEARPRVWKLRRCTLAPGATAAFGASVSFAPMTTRRHYPGAHLVEARVNGVALPLGEFDLRR